MTTISDKLQQVLCRIQQACAAAGRDAQAVRLLAVSKTFGPDAVLDAAAAGQRAFGENYIQEAVDKIQAVRAAGRTDLEWHCIGPIQSNKTRLVAEHFDWVHSVDRARTAERLSAQRPAGLAPLQVCLQVNIDGGATKSGVAPDEAEALARAVAALPGLRLRGLMSIPEPLDDAAAMQAVHARLAALHAQLRDRLQDVLPEPEAFDTLSMGMTADLEAAIAAGSTMVRVGTGIFGGRAPRPVAEG